MLSDMQLTQSHLLSFVAAYKSHIASVHQDGGVSPTEIQYDAPWPLDRIDQDTLPLNQQYSYFNDGSNVNVYIIDTVGPFTSRICKAIWLHVSLRSSYLCMPLHQLLC